MKIIRTGIIVLLTSTMFTSCEEKAFDVVLNLVFSQDFTVNTASSFNEEYGISGKEINDAIEDVPDTASLDSIRITSLYATIEVLPGNTAEQIVVGGEGRYSAVNNGEYFTVFGENTINLPAVGDSIEIRIENLEKSGVQNLKHIMNTLALDPSIADDDEFSIKVENHPLPSGSTVHAEITVYLNASAVFEYETDLFSATENGSANHKMVAGLHIQD